MVLCLIVGCGNKTGKRRPTGEKFSFFRVPRVIVNQGQYAEDLTTERRRRWISAISRDDLTDAVLENDRVCSSFVSGQAAKDWDRFNVDWIPALHLGHSKQQTKDSEGAIARSERAAERRKRRAGAVDKEIEEQLKKLDEPGDTVSEIFSVAVVSFAAVFWAVTQRVTAQKTAAKETTVAEAVNATDLDLEKDQKETPTNRENNTLDAETQTRTQTQECKKTESRNPKCSNSNNRI